jgi:hypothetical protein
MRLSIVVMSLKIVCVDVDVNRIAAGEFNLYFRAQKVHVVVCFRRECDMVSEGDQVAVIFVVWDGYFLIYFYKAFIKIWRKWPREAPSRSGSKPCDTFAPQLFTPAVYWKYFPRSCTPEHESLTSGRISSFSKVYAAKTSSEIAA